MTRACTSMWYKRVVAFSKHQLMFGMALYLLFSYPVILALGNLASLWNQRHVVDIALKAVAAILVTLEVMMTNVRNLVQLCFE